MDSKEAICSLLSFLSLIWRDVLDFDDGIKGNGAFVKMVILGGAAWICLVYQTPLKLCRGKRQENICLVFPEFSGDMGDLILLGEMDKIIIHGI